jgi:hypothetical protein
LFSTHVAAPHHHSLLSNRGGQRFLGPFLSMSEVAAAEVQNFFYAFMRAALHSFAFTVPVF